MSLSAGHRLGPYEIVGPPGAEGTDDLVGAEPVARGQAHERGTSARRYQRGASGGNGPPRVGARLPAAVRATSLDTGAWLPLDVSGRRVRVALTRPAHEVDLLVLDPRRSKLGP